jgi:hypothetical protein
MLRKLALFVVFILVMGALSAGAWSPNFLGEFCREIQPLIAFFLYFGLGYTVGSNLGASRALVVCSLIAHLLLYVTPFAVGYYQASSQIAESMAKETGSEVSHAQAAASFDLFLEKGTGFQGIPGYAVYSERRSLSAANVKEYAARQFEDVDDLGPLLSAVLNTVLYTIPIALKWLLTDKLTIVGEPGYIGLVFWYLVALAFFIFGFAKGQE